MEQNEIATGREVQPMEQQPVVDPEKAEAFKQQLESQQNLPLGIGGGLVAAIVGASVWAGVTVATQYQIGWMAVGVGFLVGYAVSKLGKGISKTFGYVGAVCALVGCLLGNLLSTCGFIALEESMPFFQVVSIVFVQPSIGVDLLKATFSPMDLLFYGIAVYEGYKFSFRRITPAEQAALFTAPE